MPVQLDDAAAVTATNEIKSKIRRHIAQNLLFSDDFTYGDDVSFLENGVIDSVGVLDLVLFIEETFGIHIAGQDMTPENFDSVDNLARYIQGRLPRPLGS